MMKASKKICSRLIVVLLISVMILQPVEVSAFKAGAHAVLTVDVAGALPETSIIRRAMEKYPNIAAWGATGPDIPANTAAIIFDRAPWFERYHYEKVGSFVAEQLRLALESGDEKKIAWAAGWVTHAVGDLYCHGVYVNPDPEVNGVYMNSSDDAKEMHGKLEAYADKLLYQDKGKAHEQYNPANMQKTFLSFDAGGVIDLARQASFNTYGISASKEDYEDWMDFFKDIYLDTGIAGGSNWVYSYSYDEVKDLLSKGKVAAGKPFGGMTRMQRLDKAYSESIVLSSKLLQDAERGLYHGFSDKWNLDAYHEDGRSIGTLTVQIRTADVDGAGTDDDIYFGMILEDGTQWKSKALDKEWYNDFERGDNDYYYLYVDSHDFPIANIKKVFLTKESDGILGGAWKCASLRATVNGKAIYDGEINTWLEDGSLTWTGDTTNIVPNRIYVYLSGSADAYTDRIEGTASMGNDPYIGEVTINIKRKNSGNENYKVMTDSKGRFTYSVPLSPEDYVSLDVYRPHERVALWTYEGSSQLGYARVPFERITLTGDAFNDVIKGEVSGNYTGPLDIVIERDSAENVLSANVSQGVFSLPAELIGGDRIYPRLSFEGTVFPREQIVYNPALNTLNINYTNNGNDIDGTITNSISKSAKSYTGDVTLSTKLNGRVLVQKAVQADEPDTGGTQRMAAGRRAQISSRSTYSFKNVSEDLKLGYSITIEHDGIVKGLSYDPLEGVKQEANLPKQNTVISIQEKVVDPVSNPVTGIKSPIESIKNPAANIGLNPGAVNSGSMMLAPVQGNAAQSQAAASSFAGLWMTDYGSMIITEEQGVIKGVYGNAEFTLEGRIIGNVFKGTFVEGNKTGEFEFTLNPGGKGFSGKRRLNGETSWNSWNGM